MAQHLPTPGLNPSLPEEALAQVHGGGKTTPTDMAQAQQLSLQSAMQKYQQTYATLANILRKLSGTRAQIAQNLR